MRHVISAFRGMTGGSAKAFLLALVAVVAGGGAAFAQAAGDAMIGAPVPWGIGLQPSGGPIKDAISSFNSLVFWIIVAITIFVFLLLVYVVVKFNAKANPNPSQTSHNTVLEIAWTVVPFIIVVALGVVATGDLVAQKDTSNSDITVKATGYQWKWGYDYLKGEGEGISMLSTLTTPREQIEDRNFPEARAKRDALFRRLFEVHLFRR